MIMATDTLLVYRQAIRQMMRCRSAAVRKERL